MYYFVLGDRAAAAKVYGYHLKCYRRFCDVSKIARAKNRTKQERYLKRPSYPEEPVTLITPSPKKRLRSHHVAAAISGKSSKTCGVLPPICLICKRASKYTRDYSGKRIVEKLIMAETLDAGMFFSSLCSVQFPCELFLT